MTALLVRIVSRSYTNLHNKHRTPRPMLSSPRFLHLAVAARFQKRRQHRPVILVCTHSPRRLSAVHHPSAANTAV